MQRIANALIMRVAEDIVPGRKLNGINPRETPRRIIRMEIYRKMRELKIVRRL